MRPVVKPIIETTGYEFSLTVEEARKLYWAIDRTLSAAGGADFAGNRDKMPEAHALFELYDALYGAGVTN